MEEDNTILYFFASKPGPNLLTSCGMMNCYTTHASNVGVDLLDKPVAQQNITKLIPCPSNPLVLSNNKLQGHYPPPHE